MPRDPAELDHKLDVFQSAHAHVMGRVAYAAMSVAMSAATDHPFFDILNTGRKVVFSRTLTTAEWANTTIAAGDMTEEIDKLRRGGDGHIVVWGGVRLWRSLMQRDLIDELRVDLHPYIAGRAPGCSTVSRGPTGSTWCPARPSTTGSSGCSTAGLADPAVGPAVGSVIGSAVVVCPGRVAAQLPMFARTRTAPAPHMTIVATPPTTRAAFIARGVGASPGSSSPRSGLDRK